MIRFKIQNSKFKIRYLISILIVNGTVPDLRTEQSEVVESGLSPHNVKGGNYAI